MQPPVLLPALPLANPPEIPAPWLELPRAVVPSYTPMVYPYAPVNDVGIPPASQEQPPEKPAATLAITPASIPPIAIQPPPAWEPSPEIEPAKTIEAPAQPISAETTTITLPGTAIQIPMPKAEILSAAATTSVISVAATLGATALFKRLVSLFKPVISVAVKRLQKMRGKPVKSWARQRLAQRHHRLLQTAIPAQK